MVYYGRPSTSCFNCRSNKRRCDREFPCGQCLRKGENCRGYREGFIFRDETTHIIQRSRRGARRDAKDTPTSQVQESKPLSWVEDAVESGATITRGLDTEEDSHGQIEIGTSSEAPSAFQWSGEEVSISTLYSGNRQGVEDGVDMGVGQTGSFLNGPLVPYSSCSAMPLSRSSWQRKSSLFDRFSISSLQPSLTPQLGDIARQYFISNYIELAVGSSHGFLDFILPVLTRDANADTETITAAIKAVGLAGLANTTVTGQINLMQQARSSYAEALGLVNQALSSSDGAAVRDSTIITVMVFGLFESITCSSSQSLEAWTRHINGTAALLTSRGTTQFQTNIGVRIFREAVSQLLINCVRLGVPLPPAIRLLRAQAAEFVDTSDPTWVMTGAFIEAMELWERIDPGETDSRLGPEEWGRCLSQLVTVDRELERCFSFPQLPIEWQFMTINDHTASPVLVYQSTYHLYNDNFTAKIWNSMRACRIMINVMIRAILCRDAPASASDELLDGPYTNLLQQAIKIPLSMRDEILASVPQMLGHVHCSTLHYTEILSEAKSSVVLGGYFLLWILYFAGGILPETSPEIRDWVASRLIAIRSLTGLQKAEYLAFLLESGQLD